MRPLESVPAPPEGAASRESASEVEISTFEVHKVEADLPMSGKAD